MKYQQKKTIVPPWVSCHTYLWGSEESRSYISNEKTHTYILLEGAASDLWKLLCDGVPEQELYVWAHEKGLEGQVDSFLDELAAQGCWQAVISLRKPMAFFMPPCEQMLQEKRKRHS